MCGWFNTRFRCVCGRFETRFRSGWFETRSRCVCVVNLKPGLDVYVVASRPTLDRHIIIE